MNSLYTLKINGLPSNNWTDLQKAGDAVSTVIDALVAADAKCHVTLEQSDATPSIFDAKGPSHLVVIFEARIAVRDYRVDVCHLVFEVGIYKLTA